MRNIVVGLKRIQAESRESEYAKNDEHKVIMTTDYIIPTVT
jgi:hypothetical protein